MLYENITPKDYVERKTCENIFLNLKEHFYDNTYLFVRSWNQEIDYSKYDYDKYVTIVTSAEGHNYIPKEQEDSKCLGVFMHYYPKISTDYQFNPEEKYFQKLDKVWPIPLGTTNFYQGHNGINFNDRTINCSFIGQLDPYRRYDFFDGIGIASTTLDDSVFQFYKGWNNGVGPEKYSEVMSNTKIALVPCGSASLDTFRLYEAAKAGCVILSCVQNEYPFLKKMPIIPVNDWSQVGIMVNSLLSGVKHLATVSKNTFNFWEKNLSPKATANYILERLLENA